MRDYEAGLKKADLIDGAYYRGICRHSTEARWDGVRQRFYYWRSKFDRIYVEQIAHNEDDKDYDVFNAFERIDKPREPIPLPPRKATRVRYQGKEYDIEECWGDTLILKGLKGAFGIGSVEYIDD
jgi:hypothetical protein